MKKIWIIVAFLFCLTGVVSTIVFTDSATKTSTEPPVTIPEVEQVPVIDFTPAGQDEVPYVPSAPVAVRSFFGTLDNVQLSNDQGKAISGNFFANNTAWMPNEVLGYGKQYTFRASATNTHKRTTTQSISFTTAIPSNKTHVYLNDTGGHSLINGGTYGIGVVIDAHFDEPIPDKAAAESRLHVTTSPPVKGSWMWISSQDARWRPRDFYPSGTKVKVEAKIFGLQLGPGLYGQDDSSVEFSIGPDHRVIADDNTHMVKVYDNNKLIRTMPTSMGKGGYIDGIGGTKISLFTPSGTYTVIGRGNPVIMDSSTFGLPVKSPHGYKEKIYYATRISVDGIYLHELDTTVWAQGSVDTSHGCLNLNQTNAAWFYRWALDGDPVTVQNTGGPPLKQWQNGDWSVPWNQWLQGSALHNEVS